MNDHTFRLLTAALLTADRQTMGNAIGYALGKTCDDLNVAIGSFVCSFAFESGEQSVTVIFATKPEHRAKLKKFIDDEAGAEAVTVAENEGVNALRRRGE